jgi:hypothetical protein
MRIVPPTPRLDAQREIAVMGASPDTPTTTRCPE